MDLSLPSSFRLYIYQLINILKPEEHYSYPSRYALDNHTKMALQTQINITT